MKLRDSLIPNATPQRIQIVLEQIKTIENGIHQNSHVDDLIKAFNQFTHRHYTKQYFINFRKHESIEQFSNDAAQIPSLNITDITEQELTEMVRRIRTNDFNAHFYMEIIDNNINCNEASNFIYFPENQGLLSHQDIASFILMFHNS